MCCRCGDVLWKVCDVRWRLEVVLCLLEVLEATRGLLIDSGGCGGCVLFAGGVGGVEVIRCVLLCMREALEGGLCLLEALEVMRRVLCMLEGVEGELCLLEVLEVMPCVLLRIL